MSSHASSAAVAAPDLPAQLTRFIGRERELTEVMRLLGTTRLLTLTGAGGSGMTRLAREAAARAAEAGTYQRLGWVGLASLADRALVPEQTATALRVPERAGASAIDSLRADIADTSMLLVLDNCEHLVDACAGFVETLLLGCPRLTVLATSREALGVPSETAWLVPPLEGGEAVQLFVERAQGSLSSFTITDANAPAVREICRRVDGIPLAIELAAARIRVLSAEQIAGRLDDAFRLLSAGSRTALPRHRTLRGAMDWSYALLTERERVLLHRLAVFSGSYSLEAAEVVCAGAPLEEEDILDGVSALVDKSLVVMESSASDVRYRLLETVRQYAEERLTAAGELAQLRRQHADFFVRFAESAGIAWIRRSFASSTRPSSSARSPPRVARSSGRTRERWRRWSARCRGSAATCSTASRPATGISSIATDCNACTSMPSWSSAREGERHAKAGDVYRRVLARDELHEDATHALMSCHARMGERTQAIRVYQRFADRLRTELEAEPDEDMRELVEQIRAG